MEKGKRNFQNKPDKSQGRRERITNKGKESGQENDNFRSERKHRSGYSGRNTDKRDFKSGDSGRNRDKRDFRPWSSETGSEKDGYRRTDSDRNKAKRDFRSRDTERGADKRGYRSSDSERGTDKRGYGSRDSERGTDKRNYRSRDSERGADKRDYRSRDSERGADKRGYRPRDSERETDRSDFRPGEKKSPYGKRTFRRKEDSFEYGKTMKPQKRPDYSREKLLKVTDPKNKARIQEDKGNDLIRLNKFIANAGLCSRREADVLIESGQITVNGKVVTEMGYKVRPIDVVKYGRKILNKEKLVYILLNKPKDYITTTDDPEGRRTVMELVEEAVPERIYPVGRLDRGTTGLLLFTNDGELAEKLAHPSHEIRKIYQAEIDKPISGEDFEKLILGVELEDGFIKPDKVSIITPDQHVIGMEIHSGKNRVVRRIFEHLGYEVTQLDRTTYAGLTKKGLIRGNWRFLTEKEVIRLKYLI